MPMANLYKRNSKATLCSGKSCVTVYGKTAEFVEALTVVTATIVAIAWLAKLLK
jgi:hypothetical protein